MNKSAVREEKSQLLSVILSVIKSSFHEKISTVREIYSVVVCSFVCD